MPTLPTEITRLFDKYNRQARIYPAIIAGAPLIYSAVLLFPDVVSSVSHAAATSLVVLCVLYLLSNLSRSLGKKVEERLILKWGGWPTTTLLRHRDERIDRNTKARYHAALKSLSKDLVIPTANDEAADSRAADDVYRSATKRLIELRRGSAYNLILDENISYGFRRNLLGLKPISLCILAFSVAITAIGWWVGLTLPLTLSTFSASVRNYPHLPILFSIDFVFLFIWLLAINESFVLQAGISYAEALFRSLEKAK